MVAFDAVGLFNLDKSVHSDEILTANLYRGLATGTFDNPLRQIIEEKFYRYRLASVCVFIYAPAFHNLTHTTHSERRRVGVDFVVDSGSAFVIALKLDKAHDQRNLVPPDARLSTPSMAIVPFDARLAPE